MRHVSEVERFGRDSGEEAGVDRFARRVQTAVAIYLLPVLAVVLVIGLVAILVQGMMIAFVWVAQAFRLKHEKLASGPSSQKALLSLIPGQSIATRNGIRCGRYVPILGHVGEPSWSPCPTVSLH